MTRGPGDPAFEGGLHVEGDAVVGCWLVDRFGLLRADHHRTEPPSVRWDVRRGQGIVKVARTTRPDGSLPDERWTPWQGRKGVAGGVTKIVSMQRFLWTVETARVILGTSRWPADETDVAPRLVHVAPPPGGEAPEDLDARARVDLASALAAVDPFLASLDQRAVALALRRAIPRDDRTLYWRADRTCGSGDPLADALDVLPELGHGLVRRYHGSAREVAAAVRAGRDALLAHATRWMRPLGERRIALTFEVVDALAALPAADRMEVWRALVPLADGDDDALHLSALLLPLPRDWVPRDPAGWAALARCWPAADHARRWAGADAGAMLGAKGDWPGFEWRLAKAHGRGPEGLRAAVEDLTDMSRAYAAEVLGPALHMTHGHAVQDVAAGFAPSLLHDGRGLCRALDASRRWHSGRHAVMDVVRRHAPRGAGVDWPRAWPDATFYGVTVSELTSVGALRAEGARGPDHDGIAGLSHCVGSHAGVCMSGEGRVLSLRRSGPDGTVRLSTAEVAWEGGRPSVRQHRGRANAPPPPEAARALAAYVEAVGGRALEVREDALAPMGGGPRHGLDTPYDHRLPGAWEAVRTAWDPFVPRRLRGASPAELHALCDGYAHVAPRDGGPRRPWQRRPPAPAAAPSRLTRPR